MGVRRVQVGPDSTPVGVVEEPLVDTLDFVKADPTPVEVEKDSVETCLVETKKLGPLVV